MNSFGLAGSAVILIRKNKQSKFFLSSYKASILYDFVRAIKSKTTQLCPVTVNVTRRYTFDDAGRVVGIYQTIDAQAEQQLAEYSYNKLRQLVDKRLHHTGGSRFSQSVD